jgi:hypothetical protein
MIAVSLFLFTNAIQAQTAKSNLDPIKLQQQLIGTWQSNTGKDTIEVWEVQKYGESFINNVSLVIKGKKSPFYIANISIDSKEGNVKGFNLNASGDYVTWIGSWFTEKKFSLNGVQNFNPQTVSGKVELLLETPTKMTFTNFNTDGKKTGEYIFNKVK